MSGPEPRRGEEVRTAHPLVLTPATRRVVEAVTRAGGRPYLVGGAVRDLLVDPGAASKDVDLEVYGLDMDALVAALAEVGTVDEVGRSFAVLKIRVDGEDVDVSLPRREVKTGAGHRGFEVRPDPHASLVEASARRDLTLNSLMYDPVAEEVVDCWGGLEDLRAGVLRHTTAAFVEDPLRVLRAVQFSARFGHALHPETAQLCRTLVDAHAELPQERLWGEWEKVGTKGRHLSAALEVLSATGWDVHYPELARLQGVPQDPVWHPEGDVWTHSGLAGDEAARLADAAGLSGRDRAVVVLGALLHDVGKADHTQLHEDGRITAHGHAEGGVAPALALLERIGAPLEVRERIAPIVREHMCATGVTPTETVVRRLARRLAPATIAEWSLVCGADKGGRGAGSRPNETVEWVAVAERVGVEREPQKLLLRGEHLMALGHRPGPGFRPVMAAALEAQDAGAFRDAEGAAAWLAEADADGRLAGWLAAGEQAAGEQATGAAATPTRRPAVQPSPAPRRHPPSRRDVYLSCDVEADGPIPGPYSMSSLGMCAAATFDGQEFVPLDPAERTFYTVLAPISDAFDPEAAAVSGLDRDDLVRSAPSAEQAMAELTTWIARTCEELEARPVFVGYPLGFDWLFTYWYLVRFTGGSPFGHSAHLDMKTMYARAEGVRIGRASKRYMPVEVRGRSRHTHHALDDAKEQAALFCALWRYGGG